MRRVRQSLDVILASISEIQTSWQDSHSAAVVNAINSVPIKPEYDLPDLRILLEGDFEAAKTMLRLFLGLSGDEFEIALREALGGSGTGVKRFRSDPQGYLEALGSLGILETIAGAIHRPTDWRDLLIERLKSGRGSAIKGQQRGRALEDFVEAIIRVVFGEGNYDTRCRFFGATGESTEKTDFAIPNRRDPSILIEAKGYGATGSKQTDVLGDVERICREKRPDTDFLLVTDGQTWRSRQSDLAKLVIWQNQGRITRIYTQSMAVEFEADLVQLKSDHSL
jgi:hypothetical protein